MSIRQFFSLHFLGQDFINFLFKRCWRFHLLQYWENILIQLVQLPLYPMCRQITRKIILFSQEKVFCAWREFFDEFLVDWMVNDALRGEVDNTSC